MVERVGQHGGDLIELRRRKPELGMSVVQRLSGVLEGASGDRAEPECP
jgi:hypothetical protein